MQRGQHLVGLHPGDAVDHCVVGVTFEGHCRELPRQPPIKRVVHEQVRQDGRDRGSLWGSTPAGLQGPIGQLQVGGQPPLHIQHHPTRLGVLLDGLDDQVPPDTVEELPDVQIDHPVVLPAAFPAGSYRIQRRPLRPIAVGARMEHGFHPGLQMRGHHWANRRSRVTTSGSGGRYGLAARGGDGLVVVRSPAPARSAATSRSARKNQITTITTAATTSPTTPWTCVERYAASLGSLAAGSRNRHACMLYHWPRGSAIPQLTSRMMGMLSRTIRTIMKACSHGRNDGMRRS